MFLKTTGRGGLCFFLQFLYADIMHYFHKYFFVYTWALMRIPIGANFRDCDQIIWFKFNLLSMLIILWENSDKLYGVGSLLSF